MITLKNSFMALEAGMNVFLQTKFPILQTIFTGVSWSMSPLMILTVWIPLIGSFDAEFLIDALILVATGSFVSTMMKWFFPEDRPYWWVKETDYFGKHPPTISVFEETCETTSGTVSAHCVIFTIFLLLLCDKFSDFFKSDEEICSGVEGKMIGKYVIAFSGSIAMWISRMYLGTLFLHQCILGSIVGAVIFHYYKNNDRFQDITIYAEKSESVRFAIFCSIFVAFFYGGMKLLGLDLQWPVKAAFEWCGNPDYLKVDTTPVYSIMRDLGIIFGIALASPLEDKKYQTMINWKAVLISGAAVAGYYSFGLLIPTGSGRCPFFTCVFFRHLFYVYGLAHILPTWFWIAIMFTIFSISTYITIFAWQEFMTNPAITTLESREYPIWKIPFPAVGLCSVNKMSRNAVQGYAGNLFKNIDNITTLDELVGKVRFLGALIDAYSVSRDEAAEFQNILDMYEANENGIFDSRKALQMLAPKCDDLLMRCQWLGKRTICSTLFYREAIPGGFCCIFNYMRNFQGKDNVVKPKYANMTGSNQGLVVLLNSSIVDYFYTRRNTVGFVAKIFNPKSFPDDTTGGVEEHVVNPLDDTYLKLLATTLTSVNALRPYSTAQRRCYFPDEIFHDFGNSYSFSNCLTKCKLRSIKALCHCVPFWAPPDLIEESKKTAYCTLADITCLQRYEVTWNTYRPEIKNIEGLESEMEDSLSCVHCLPLCSNTVYRSEAAIARLSTNGTERMNWGILKGITNLTSLSLVRVYFSTAKTLLYKKDVVYTWYEILGYFGGLLGICLGCSIISVIEIVYFATYKLYMNIKNQNIITPVHSKNNFSRN